MLLLGQPPQVQTSTCSTRGWPTPEFALHQALHPVPCLDTLTLSLWIRALFQVRILSHKKAQ